MNKKLKRQLNKYYKQINDGLSCSFNVKKVFINDIKSTVKELISINHEISFDEIVENCGTPEDIRNSFYTLNIKELKRKTIKYIIAEIFLIILIYFFISALISIIMNCCGVLVGFVNI